MGVDTAEILIEDAARDFRAAAAQLHELVEVQQVRYDERVELMTAYDENRRLRDELTVRRALRVRLTHYIVGLSDRVLCLFVISAVVLFAAMAAVAAVGALT